METLLLPLLLVAVFYFVLIRPQQKQRREIAQLQSTIGPPTSLASRMVAPTERSEASRTSGKLGTAALV